MLTLEANCGIIITYQLRNKTDTTMAKMTLRLPEALDLQLKSQSQENGISKHQLILDLLGGGSGLGYSELPQDTLRDLQIQIEQLQKKVKVLAEHAGYPFGTF